MNKQKDPTDPAVMKAVENKYVQNVNGNTLIYNTEFYIAMSKLLDKGKTAVEAYRELGFDTEKLGENRACAAARRARKMAAGGSFVNPKNFDGSLSRKEMGEMTPEQEVAWLKARNLYLERCIEIEKKKQSQLVESHMLYRERKLKNHGF